MKPESRGQNMSRRRSSGQSEIVGLVTIFGIVFVSISIILLAGLPVIEDATENTQIERFQTEFALLDQQIRESVYGPGQSSASINPSGGRISVDNGSSSMTVGVTYRPETGGSVSTGEIPLGGIEYDAEGDRGVVYEGGGIWSKYRGGALSLREPPDVSYSGGTLNMNMMNFTSERVVGGSTPEGRGFYFASGGTHRGSSLEDITDRPLDAGELEISVKSEFAEGWAEYFNRTTASSTVDVETGDSSDDRGFANVTLRTGPPLYSIENALNHSGDSSTDANINPGNEVNVTDSRIGDVVLGNYTESELNSNQGPPRGIDDLPDVANICFREFEGEDLSGVSSPVTSGTYDTDNSDDVTDETFVADGGDIEIYTDTGLTFSSSDTTVFDTSGGDIEIHVDGQLTLNGDIEINGSNSVYFYVNDLIRAEADSNVKIEDERTERLQLFAADEARITGSANYNGTVYTQEEIDIGGSSELTGAAITSDVLDIGGNDYTHDTSLRGTAPDCADEPLRNFNAVERRIAVR